MELITSIENEKVKYWTKLQQKKYRDQENLFLVEGEHLVNEAVANNYIKEIILKEGIEYKTNLPIHYVTKEIMTKLSTLNTPSNMIAVCYKIKEKEYGNKILLLDDIQDPGNLGTMIRSAIAFAVDTIILSENSVDIYNDKVVRASQGMIFNINIIRSNIDELFINRLKNEKYQIIGTKVDGGTTLKNIKLNTKYALILGNEGQGVNEELLKMCDNYVYIPMTKECESLNVGVAASIIMYEFMVKYEN